MPRVDQDQGQVLVGHIQVQREAVVVRVVPGRRAGQRGGDFSGSRGGGLPGKVGIAIAVAGYGHVHGRAQGGTVHADRHAHRAAFGHPVGHTGGQQRRVVDGRNGGLDDDIGDGDIFAALRPHRRSDDEIAIRLGSFDVEVMHTGGDRHQRVPGEAGRGGVVGRQDLALVGDQLDLAGQLTVRVGAGDLKLDLARVGDFGTHPGAVRLHGQVEVLVFGGEGAPQAQRF